MDFLDRICFQRLNSGRGEIIHNEPELATVIRALFTVLWSLFFDDKALGGKNQLLIVHTCYIYYTVRSIHYYY